MDWPQNLRPKAITPFVDHHLPDMTSPKHELPKDGPVDWSRLQINLAPSQGFIRHPANRFISEAWFKKYLRDYDFWFINGGEALLTATDGTQNLLQRGVVVLLRPMSVWSVSPVSAESEPLSMTWFHFDIVDRQTNTTIDPVLLESIPVAIKSHEPEYTETVCRRILQLGVLWRDTKISTPGYKLAGDLLRTQLQEILIQQEADEQPSGMEIDPARYLQLMSIAYELRHDLHTFPTVEHMARHCKVSVDYFTRLFKKIFNKTPMDALIAARIEKAKHLLNGTALSISQIADELGYDNIHFFSRQFKAKVGRSPLAYRRKQ